MSGPRERFEDLVNGETGHAYGWGGGTILVIVLLVVLLIWLL